MKYSHENYYFDVDYTYQKRGTPVSAKDSKRKCYGNNIIPFTKEWEWDQCCYNSVE